MQWSQPVRALAAAALLVVVPGATAADVADPVWSADPGRGTSVFEGVETKPGSVDVVEGGTAYRLRTSGRKQGSERVRVETRGHRTPDGAALRFTEGDTYYVGWRSKWGPLPTKDGDWVVLWQLKDYGSGAATPPLSLRARGDRLDLEYTDPAMKTTKLWDVPLPRDRWNDFVVGIHFSHDPGQGWVRFWYDGQPQHLAGKDQYPAATVRADFVTDKWGVYRSDGITGPATAYLADARVGRSYTEVAAR
ncbi:polysaccharide lyase [Saccharopolyspora rosea]|uniref:polysaccharide lyase n=1 Tax=Saccharopolyspora rosea TaxID=524884 RepID=UPI0021DA34DF|nr:polysaccharide lyase [Saccharopolyspora rosea]